MARGLGDIGRRRRQFEETENMGDRPLMNSALPRDLVICGDPAPAWRGGTGRMRAPQPVAMCRNDSRDPQHPMLEIGTAE
jgi:hypothetical protein